MSTKETNRQRRDTSQTSYKTRMVTRLTKTVHKNAVEEVAVAPAVSRLSQSTARSSTRSLNMEGGSCRSLPSKSQIVELPKEREGQDFQASDRGQLPPSYNLQRWLGSPCTRDPWTRLSTRREHSLSAIGPWEKLFPLRHKM